MTAAARALSRLGLASAVAVLVAALAHVAPTRVEPGAPPERPTSRGNARADRAEAGDSGAKAGLPGPRLSLNRASQADLEALPGIGPALARRILEFRAAHGPFRSAEELLLVRGIGPRKWAAVRLLVRP